VSSPELSVLLPVYNGQRFLKEAIESILSQSLTDFELIIINDGSTDGTPTILNQFAGSDSRIRIISRANTGYTIALNEGLCAARGPYLARMDADDVSVGVRFSRQVEFLETHPNCVAVGSWIQRIDHNGLPVSILARPLTHEAIDALHINGVGGGLIHPSAMFRTEALRRIGGYNPDWEPAEDLELFLRLAEIGRLANINEVLLKYRLNLGGVSSCRREEQAQKTVIIANIHRSKRGLAPLAPPDITSPESAAEQERKIILESIVSNNYATASAHILAMVRHKPNNLMDCRWLLRCGQAIIKNILLIARE
jgi:glycosyltransferase involved in cell wall biosynthesis